MPNYEYSRESGKFRSGNTEFERAVVRSEIDRLVKQSQKDMSDLAGKFQSGGISRADFEREMKNLLRSGHIIAASVGKGGRALMKQKDWGRVGGKLKWQYQYLARFARLVDVGSLSMKAAQTRAELYAHSMYVSFSKSFLDERTEIYRARENGLLPPVLARLIQNSIEGCWECAEDADYGWMPVEDMGEIGSRECGDFCKCDIEFSDEDTLEV